MLRFLIDVDGVVADYQSKFAEEAQYEVKRVLDVSKIGSAWDVAEALELTSLEKSAVYSAMDAPKVAYDMAPLPGAVAGVRELAEHADIFFVTSPTQSSPTWVFDRSCWLRAVFGEVLGRKVIHTHHKHAVVGDVFIDDEPAHVESWYEEMADYKGITLPVVWAYPHNEACEGRFLRINTWEPLIAIAIEGRLSR